MTMERSAGRPLEEALVPGQPLPWADALSVASQVGRGLQKLHETGLVHGDVRPCRILWLDPGTYGLADPGLAETSGPPPTAADRVSSSTALYMSPEQAVGERLDPRTDTFALGALAYRLLTGHDAFEADGAQRILARVLHDRPLPPSRWVAGLPPGVDGVLARALAKQWKDRYADVGRFCDDLDDLLAGRTPRNASVAPVSLETSSFLSAPGGAPAVGEVTGTLSRGMDRRPLVRGLFGLLALALVLGLELVRRNLEAPGAAPATPPLPDAPAREAGSAGAGGAADLPSLEPPPTARLSIDFRHTLESGTLVVQVDGAKVLERRVSGAVTRRILGIKLREGRLHQVVDISPGRHSISIRVRWGDDQRSDTIAGNFIAGATRTLSVGVGRIGRRLSVEWR